VLIPACASHDKEFKSINYGVSGMKKGFVRNVFLLFVFTILTAGLVPSLAWAQTEAVNDLPETQLASVTPGLAQAAADESEPVPGIAEDAKQQADDSLESIDMPEAADASDALDAIKGDTVELVGTEEAVDGSNIKEPLELRAGVTSESDDGSDAKAVTAPTSLWVDPSETNGIPATIDLFKMKTGGTTYNPTYTYQLYLPGNAVLANCFLSWDGGATVTLNNVTYASGSCPIPGIGTEVTYSFSVGNTTQSYKLIAYQGSAAVQAVFIEIDESDGKPTIAQMDGDPNHDIECSGTIWINGAEYELTKMKGRGNATWQEADDKKPYNITLGKKINFPGIDSEKTKKWSLLAECLDRSLMCNRAGYELAHKLGIGQDTASVDVWMNGEYQGCYTITPKTDSFVTKDGFMIEQDNYLEDPVAQGGDPQFTLEGLKESSGWSSAYNRITVKKIGDNLLGEDESGEVDESPENMERVAAEIQAWLQDAWDAIRSDTGYNSKGKYYTDYIDIESFAKMYLMFEYVKSYDVCAGSILFHRDGTGDDDKLIAGPLWDLDNAMGATYQNSSLGKADDRRNGDRRSGEGDFIPNVTEYKTSIYKTLGKHSDFMEEVYRQYNYYKWAFEGFEDDVELMRDSISASAQMNHQKVNDLGTGRGKDNHYFQNQTPLGSGQYQQVYLATGNAKTRWANYVANLITYIHTRSLWFSNKYTQTVVSIIGATVRWKGKLTPAPRLLRQSRLLRVVAHLLLAPTTRCPTPTTSTRARRP